ncbi:hypothetical protein DL764_007050 [Monosporascus ibericus]|uniref:Extracellular membrane protein CFEM domain-containing protein n=1 Tax=Monosporascus ibericus TaxID=155417 RepID=A0A4Q4T349_9PEZI|nr:hypothetical protein DL764_007050 [Monosporascus ibericus]
MRFTNAFVAGIFALAANAQTTESVTTTAVTSVTSPTTTRELTPEESLQAEVVECVEACDDDDVNCQANCITVPSPDEGAVNDTTACVADCPQGNGTEEDNEAYGECVQSCIADNFMTTTFTGNQPTNTGGSSQGNGEVTATPTPSVATVTSGSSTYETTVTPTNSDSPSETEGSSEDESSSDAEATDAPNAGSMPFSPIGATGLLGLVAAFFAL